MYSIAHVILKPEFARTWQEAVAIVQEVAVMADGLSAIPPAEDLSLTDDGTLAMGFLGEDEHGGHPVVALAGLLAALLDGTDAPPALRSLADDNARPAPAHNDLESFRRAVGFFERPGRTHDLAALAGRLRAAGYGGLGAEQERELERLREKAAKAPAAPPAAAPPAARVVARRLLPAAALFVALGGLAALAVWRGPMLTEFIGAAVASKFEPDVVVVTMPERAPADDAPAPGGPPDGRPADATRTALPRAAAPAPPPPAIVPTGARDVEQALAVPVASRPARGARDGTAEGSVAAAGTSSRVDGTPIYSPADPGVEPPVLVRRQLPSTIDLTADMGHFDLVVDASGRVEQVRLTSPTGDYRERILVAAAKAWQFTPARLDGQPVRFEVRIPITLPRDQ